MMVYNNIQLRSFTDRDGVILGFYWVDVLTDRISRWTWPTEADARLALRDGIEWES